jgi:hypothetical protein
MKNKKIDIVKEFKKVRDIPYRIPLSLDEKDECCTGKAEMLFKIFKNAGFDVRYRVCNFRWSSLNLPKELQDIPHENDCSHTYLEVKVNGGWKIVDATWDAELKAVFHINEWDGESDTEISLPPLKIMSPTESLEHLKHILTPEAISADLKTSGEFYKAFNEWLEKHRKSK